MQLKKPLVVLDLETTGPWVDRDRVIEIAMIKCLPGGGRLTYHKRVNPGMPIPPVVQQLTGITNEAVKAAPAFKEIAREVLEFIGESDLGGYNLERFDLPLLEREIREASLTWDWQKLGVYDAQKVYHLNEKRDLTAAYKFYCGKELGEDAHSALADTEATLEILAAQARKYGDGAEDIDVLSRFDYTNHGEYYDKDRRFRWWNGELYMMFGKYAKRTPLKEIAKKDRGYLEWIVSANFSQEVKDLVAGALEGNFPDPPATSENQENA